jgi:hypothetical protein
VLIDELAHAIFGHIAHLRNTRQSRRRHEG